MEMTKGLAILTLALAPGFALAGDQTVDAVIGGGRFCPPEQAKKSNV